MGGATLRADPDLVIEVAKLARSLGLSSLRIALIVQQRYGVHPTDVCDGTALMDLSQGQAEDLKQHLQELIHERNSQVV